MIGRNDATDELAELRADNERLRVANAELRDEVERLRGELYRLGRYLGPPAVSRDEVEQPHDIEWGYWRGDIEDDLGDD